MENVSRQLDKAGKKLQKTGQNLSRNITAPIAALGLVATATFAGFEQQLAKVQAVSGATGSEFQALKKNAEDLGAATRFTAKEVAGLQLNFSKLGFSPDEILQVTQATLNLAQATGEDLSMSATVAASTIRGFQLDASETGRVTDVMAKSFSSSALDLEKFKTAMSTVAPVAKTAGQSIEDTTGFISVLVNAGIDASTAGTGLRNIFLEVAKSGKTLEGALGEINSSSNKNATALQLFGKRGATVATVLAENIGQAKSFAETYRNAGGEAARMAAIMDNTLEGSLARLKSATEGAAIAFGEVMAPAIRSMVDTLSEAVGSFKQLSPQTKQFIVVTAGIAAAIGPAIIAVGTLLRNLSAIIPVMRALTVAIAANPIGALAVAIGAIGGALLVTNSRFEKLTNAQEEFAAITGTATKNIAGEKAQLEKLLAIARNETVSKGERIKAVQNLNALSPEYLGNLTLEKINTDAATVATDKYVASLLQKSKVIAAEEKLVEVQRELLELQLGTSEAADPSIWQNLSNAILSAGNQSVFLAKTTASITENLTEEERQLVLLQAKLTEFLGDNAALANSNANVANSFKEVAAATSSVGGSGFSADTSVTGASSGISPFEDGSPFAQAGDDLDAFQNQVNNINLDKAKQELMSFRAEQERLQQVGEAVGNALGSAFANLGQAIGEGLGAAEGGFRGFIGTLAETATQLIAIMLSQSIASSIAGASASGAATGPAAIFTTPSFIATAVSGVVAAFAAIPKFETGGIVGGASYTGDKILARVNSGELILNTAQQESLFSQLNSNDSMHISGEFRARGNDLIAVLDRQNQRNKAIGGNGA